MNKIKVMTVVGTRPEIIRLSRVITAMDRYFEHTLVHTGQNFDYELNEVFFEDLGLRGPDHFLNAAGRSAVETIGNTLINLDPILENEQPEAMLILGDTNSSLAAITAKRRKIPIFHMEAGNRCFDQRVPEEINRKIVDHISDINLTYSDIAREYLLQEGLSPDRVIKTGSPMCEVLKYYDRKINSSDILQCLKLKQNDYFVVSAHREENIESDQNATKLFTILNTIAKVYGKRIIVSTHPRTRMRIKQMGASFADEVQLLAPLAFCDYIQLQKNAYAVLSDSGTVNEESSILNFPALNLREVHERPEGMEEAAVIMTGLEVDRILQALNILENQPRGNDRLLRQVTDYSMSNVSEKVVRIIVSYTDYVKRNVWKQY